MKQFVLALTILAAVPGVAFAQGKGSGVCKDDIQKFCQGVKAGEGRLMQCLTEHKADLSAECQAAMGKQGK